jgi:O-antigen/teichoic acid export membrane protein
MQSADGYDYWVDDPVTLPLPVADGRPVIRGPRVQIPPRHAPEPRSRNPIARVFSELRNPAYRGSYALVANTVGTSGIGAIFWAVAARLYGPEALGRAAALISALMLVATLSQLNLSSTLMRFLPQMGAMSARRLIIFSYLASSLTAVAGSVIFVTILPRLNSEWRFIGDSAFLTVLFAVSVVVWEVFTLQDAVLVGLQRAAVVPVENVIYSLAKLGLLVFAAQLLGSTNILFSWVTPLIFLIPVINWVIFRCLKDRRPHDLVPGLRVRHLARFASVDYAGTICGQVMANSLPLLVISVLGPAAAGSIYIASLITSGVATVGTSFSTGLLVEAAAAPDRLSELTRGALKRAVIIMGPATIVLVFGAHLILRIYGGTYSTQTAVLFQLMALSLIPLCIEAIAFSLDRIAGKPIRATLSQLAMTVLTLGGSWLLFGRLGINAVGVAWLGTDVFLAIVRLPTVLAALRGRPGMVARPASAPPQPPAPRSRAEAQPQRPAGPPPQAPAPRSRAEAQPQRPAGPPPQAPAPRSRAEAQPQRPAGPPPQAPAPEGRAEAQSHRLPHRRNYSGRHRATGPGKDSSTGRK